VYKKRALGKRRAGEKEGRRERGRMTLMDRVVQ